VAFGPRVPGTAAHDSCGALAGRAAARRRPRRAVIEQSFEDPSGFRPGEASPTLVASFWKGGLPGRGAALLFAGTGTAGRGATRRTDPALRPAAARGPNDGGLGVAVLV